MTTATLEMLCRDCFIVGDLGAAEIRHEMSDKRADEVCASWERFAGDDRVVYLGEDHDTAFSWHACPCCGSTLGGVRYAYERIAP